MPAHASDGAKGAILMFTNIIYILSIVLSCYFAQVENVYVNDYKSDGTPYSWYVYWREPTNHMLTRSLTLWPNYAISDWLQICDNTMPWGEWRFTRLPLIIR